MTNEEWRDIPGFPDYQASSIGRIRRTTDWHCGKAGTVISQRSGVHGYLIVNLRQGNKRVTRSTHRFIAMAFLGEPEIGQQVGHIDGKRTNNHVGNLKWCYPKENAEDKHRHGTTVRGGKVNFAKLTEDRVIEIFHAAGTQTEIGRKYGVSQQLVSRIKAKGVWPHVWGDKQW